MLTCADRADRVHVTGTLAATRKLHDDADKHLLEASRRGVNKKPAWVTVLIHSFSSPARTMHPHGGVWVCDASCARISNRNRIDHRALNGASLGPAHTDERVRVTEQPRGAGTSCARATLHVPRAHRGVHRTRRCANKTEVTATRGLLHGGSQAATLFELGQNKRTQGEYEAAMGYLRRNWEMLDTMLKAGKATATAAATSNRYGILLYLMGEPPPPPRCRARRCRRWWWSIRFFLLACTYDAAHPRGGPQYA